jgi:uncharacterized OB-fold protein
MSFELIELAENEDNRKFWEFIAAEEFKLQKCMSCGAFRYPCSYICPKCGQSDHNWVAIDGRGTVYSWTVLHKLYNKSFEKKPPYNLAVIALQEGVHFLSNVECVPERLNIGLKVRAVIRQCDDGSRIPQFQEVHE